KDITAALDKRRAEQQARAAYVASPLTSVASQLPDTPADAGSLLVPPGYALALSSTIRGGPGGGGPIADAPILITGKLRDAETGIECFRLAWLSPRGWRRKVVDRG